MRFQKWFLGALVLCGTMTPASWAQTSKLRQAFPQETLLYVELDGGRSLYDAFLASAAWKSFYQSEAFKKYTTSEGYQQFEAGRRVGTNFLGSDPVELVVQALGSKAALAVWKYKDEGVRAGLIAQADDAVKTAFGRFADLAVMDEKNRRVSKDGCDVLVFEQGALALSQGNLVFAVDEAEAVRLAKGLDGSAGKGREPGFSAVVNLKAIQELGESEGFPDPEDAVGVLLAGGWTRILRASTELQLTGRVIEGALSIEGKLDAGTDTLEEPFRNLFAADSSAPVLAADENSIASISLARNFSMWWRQRRSLFPAKDLPGLAETENVLNAFFSGPAEEVFAGMAPRLSLMVASQNYTENVPQLRLPAFALHFQVNEPKIGDRFVQAFQTGVVLMNLDRAQKGTGAPMTLENPPVEDGIRLVQARFPQETASEGQDDGLRYNFSPTCTLKGSDLVVSSAEGLARSLVAAPQSRGTGAIDRLVIRARPLTAALRDAMPMMVTNQMVEEGKSREEATRDLEAVAEVIQLFDRLELELAYQAKETRLHLEVAGRKEAP